MTDEVALKSLAAELEGLKHNDRHSDAEIAVMITLLSDGRGSRMPYEQESVEPGHYWVRAPGGSETLFAAKPFTKSIDSILDLCPIMLPGWLVSLSEYWKDGLGLYWEACLNPVRIGLMDEAYGRHGNPAIALAAAVLRAKAEQQSIDD